MAFFKPRCAAILTVVFDGRSQSAADNSEPLHIVIFPRECSVSLNGYHEADTWNIEFDQRQLPFDPDALASANIRIFMWDDADGYVGSRLDELVAINGLPRFGPLLDQVLGKFEMIRGICDDDDGTIVGEDNTVKMNGRDYTAILMAKQWDSKLTIAPGKPLDQVVQAIADDAAPQIGVMYDKNTGAVVSAGVPSASRMRVVWEAEPGRTDPSEIPACGSVHRNAKKSKGLNVKGEKNNWDVIYDLVLQHGFIAYVRNSDIVITDPATQTKQSLDIAPTFVYGKHLDSLSVKRKFGKDKVPQIIIRTTNPETDELIEVIYPAKTNVIVDGLAVKKNEQEFFPAPKGVIDPEALMRYARIMFHYKGRGETTYEFKTHCLNLTDPVTGVRGHDLLRLHAGSPVGIKYDPFNKEHYLKLDVNQRYEHIRSLGYSEDVARFAAVHMQSILDYQQPYYLSAAKYDYSIDQGLEIEITANNFASANREANFAAESDAAGQSATLFEEQLSAVDAEPL